jgi:hypothetical protein
LAADALVGEEPSAAAAANSAASANSVTAPTIPSPQAVAAGAANAKEREAALALTRQQAAAEEERKMALVQVDAAKRNDPFGDFAGVPTPTAQLSPEQINSVRQRTLSNARRASPQLNEQGEGYLAAVAPAAPNNFRTAVNGNQWQSQNARTAGPNGWSADMPNSAIARTVNSLQNVPSYNVATNLAPFVQAKLDMRSQNKMLDIGKARASHYIQNQQLLDARRKISGEEKDRTIQAWADDRNEKGESIKGAKYNEMVKQIKTHANKVGADIADIPSSRMNELMVAITANPGKPNIVESVLKRILDGVAPSHSNDPAYDQVMGVNNLGMVRRSGSGTGFSKRGFFNVDADIARHEDNQKDAFDRILNNPDRTRRVGQ